METWLIAAGETRAALEGKKFESVEELLKAAMRRTKDHWMETSEEGRFKAAVAAALALASPEDRTRIEDALKPMQALGALMGGLPVDMVALEQQVGGWEKLIPLRKMWDAIKAETVA